MPHPAEPYLLVMSIAAAAPVRQVALRQNIYTIGRDPANDLSLSDTHVSHRHLRLSRQHLVWQVERLPGAAPLYVNGQPLDRAQLQDGDQIVVGGTALRLIVPPDASAANLTSGHQQTMRAVAPVPTLTVVFPGGAFAAPLRTDVVTLGRAPDSVIVVPCAIIGTHHAVLRSDPAGGYTLYDLGSLNGLRYQGTRITSRALQPGDVVTIGERGADEVRLTFNAPRLAAATGPISVPLGSGMATIGRDPASTFALPNPQVSWQHARLMREPSGASVLQDLGSTNGTYVNFSLIRQPQRLAPGDRINIGPYEFAFDGLQLNPIARPGATGMRVDAVQLTRTVRGGRKTLLDRVALSILPGEFLAIVGGNGAGKSTLLKALIGLEPAQEGAVLFNGIDAYQHAAVLRGSIGYVPQADIVHGALTVEQALYYAARLRLARDVTEPEIQQRIDVVLNEMELTHKRHEVIHPPHGGGALSGGERKRVSIAVELLAEPPILFLDEPEAALDPQHRNEVVQVLRKLADRGQTVVLVTHHPESTIDQCDRVAVMGYGGRLCYLGPPAGATAFFGVPSFAAIYGQTADDALARRWRDQFEHSPVYQHEVAAYAHQISMPTGTLSLPPSARRGWNARDAVRQRSSVEQFWLLTRRYATVFLSDKRNVAILILQAPLIALVLAAVSESQALTSANGPFEAQKTIFLLAIFAIWFGAINAVREICKEKDIYQRERLAGIGVVPYLLSKVGVLTVLCLIQTAILLLFVSARSGLPPASAGLLVPPGFELYLDLVLTGFAGLAMGLCISALAGTQDRAVSLVLLALLPQIVLGGVIFPLSGATQGVADVMVSRWAMQALGTSADLDHLYYTQQAAIQAMVAAGGVASGSPPPFTPSDYDHDPRAANYTASVAAGASWNDAPTTRREQLLITWGVLALLSVGFLSLAAWELRRRDTT